MKAKTFIPQMIHHKEAKRPRDYWGILFVGLVFTALMGSFLIDSHRDKQSASLKMALSNTSSLNIDIGQHQKS
ncbi:hypothetical protein [Marinomonas pollencensis]|uniref:Uncharacterized protein n=1 Tax=Marinomonas pollencensis TaxID=491954 RepID=A0A3E0DTL6_9GAMM|nr:hypothetical protein [Marinomonas pollencensis]REG86770.1 hypothetical protein DFP81_101338 [Marinomonas pollencensis]